VGFFCIFFSFLTMSSSLHTTGTPDDQSTSKHGDTLMLGTSAGVANVHDPRVLPLDTVTYLLRAEATRKRLHDTAGLFFAFDARINGDTSDQPQIQHRTERLRQLLQRVLPHFDMVTHSELVDRGLAATLEGIPANAAIELPELREYTRMQTAQVLQMQAEARNGTPQNFTKFGWMLAMRGNSVPVGGEVHFDEHLPPDITRMYTAPGFPLDSSNGKAPYLLNEADRATRICLPETTADIVDEVQKIRPGLSRLMHDTLRATAETILGLRSEIHAPNADVVTLPIYKTMKQRLTDESTLADLRELLAASLRHLLS
jgi:hypothetical protein